jgi:hypothetical protein
MSQTSPGASWGALSRGQQILIGASLLLFIDLFLPWNKFCADLGATDFCVSANGWHRFGLLAGVIAIAIVALEGLAAMGNDVLKGSNKGTILLSMAGVVLVSTILRVLMDSDGLAWGAWVGIVLSLAVAYGGWLRYQEAPSAGAGPGTTTTTPPPAS